MEAQTLRVLLMSGTSRDKGQAQQQPQPKRLVFRVKARPTDMELERTEFNLV